MSFYDQFDMKKNSLQLFRFLLASCVVFHHSCVLSGLRVDPLSGLGFTFGTVAACSVETNGMETISNIANILTNNIFFFIFYTPFVPFLCNILIKIIIYIIYLEIFEQIFTPRKVFPHILIIIY